jgi:EAL domain-containing protein (putative c-di-GMP-specific phosphodiesterase class I)
MYQAKDSGRDNFQIFGPEMNARVLARVRLERELRRALETKEFVVYYQPQVNVDTGQILAMEALVRWQHSERGLVYPDDFIPLAEETGLIVPLGEWVLRTACAQNRAWQDARLPPLRVAVNLSARQFRQPGLVETLARTLEETGLGAEWLDLEITETTAMGDVEFSVEVLSRLREMGVHVCLDDFGTGYCSLAYLAQFPVDGVKIDRSFVRGLPGEPDSASIVAAILSLARSLNLRAVAEGVETEAQRALLLEYQCHEMQGYLFAKPATPEESEKLLASKQPLAAPAPSIGSRPVASRSTPVVDGASGATNKSKTRTAR